MISVIVIIICFVDRGLYGMCTCIFEAVERDPMCGGAELMWTYEFNKKAITPIAQIIGCPERKIDNDNNAKFRTLGYERVCLPLDKVADTPFYI